MREDRLFNVQEVAQECKDQFHEMQKDIRKRVMKLESLDFTSYWGEVQGLRSEGIL